MHSIGQRCLETYTNIHALRVGYAHKCSHTKFVGNRPSATGASKHSPPRHGQKREFIHSNPIAANNTHSLLYMFYTMLSSISRRHHTRIHSLTFQQLGHKFSLTLAHSGCDTFTTCRVRRPSRWEIEKCTNLRPAQIVRNRTTNNTALTYTRTHVSACAALTYLPLGHVHAAWAFKCP